MPQYEWGSYLVDLLFEFGPVKAESPLEPADILAMQQVLGVRFEPWQSRLLLRLSREYMGERHAATKMHAKPPYEPAARQWAYVQRLEMERNLDKLGFK